MKKYWGILGAVFVALTLTGCGQHKQSQASDSKVKTHKVVKASHKKKAVKKTTKTTTSSKTDNTSTAFSNRSFVNTWSDVTSGIFFKGNQFIWKYTGSETGNMNDGKLVVTQGTYSYDSKSQIVTLNVQNQSKTYVGAPSQLERYYYDSVSESPANTTLKLQYVSGDMDEMKKLDGNFGSAPMEDRGTDQKLNYDNIANTFSVQKVESSMRQGRNQINSAVDFKDFLVKHDFVHAPNDMKFITANGGEGLDFDIVDVYDDEDGYVSGDDSAEPEKKVKIKYRVSLDNGVGGDMFILGDDNNVYYGVSVVRPQVSLSNDADSAYHMYYGS